MEQHFTLDFIEPSVSGSPHDIFLASFQFGIGLKASDGVMVFSVRNLSDISQAANRVFAGRTCWSVESDIAIPR